MMRFWHNTSNILSKRSGIRTHMMSFCMRHCDLHGTFVLRSEVSSVALTLQTLAVLKGKVFPDAPLRLLLFGEKSLHY
jgi:hypothetical protein